MGHSSQRIVTLLPSATEIVCELGLREQLVGVTHECDYPPGVELLPHVTMSAIDHRASSADIDNQVREHLNTGNGLYTLDAKLLESLAPDLLVTQALCEVCAVSEDEVLAVLKHLPGAPRLINLEPMSLTEVFETITLVGESADCIEVASNYRAQLEARVSRVKAITSGLSEAEKPRVGFLEWIDPLFNAGHWTPEIIEYAGGIDSFGNKHQPSATLSDDALMDADPDVLIVALCGFDEIRAAKDLENLKARLDYHRLSAVKNNRVHILDGNAYFSRPGPRLVESLEVLAAILHPEHFSKEP